MGARGRGTGRGMGTSWSPPSQPASQPPTHPPVHPPAHLPPCSTTPGRRGRKRRRPAHASLQHSSRRGCELQCAGWYTCTLLEPCLQPLGGRVVHLGPGALAAARRKSTPDATPTCSHGVEHHSPHPHTAALLAARGWNTPDPTPSPQSKGETPTPQPRPNPAATGWVNPNPTPAPTLQPTIPTPQPCSPTNGPPTPCSLTLEHLPPCSHHLQIERYCLAGRHADAAREHKQAAAFQPQPTCLIYCDRDVLSVVVDLGVEQEEDRALVQLHDLWGRRGI